MEQPNFWAIMFVFFNSLQGRYLFWQFFKAGSGSAKNDCGSTALVKTQDGERVLFDPGNKKSKKTNCQQLDNTGSRLLNQSTIRQYQLALRNVYGALPDSPLWNTVQLGAGLHHGEGVVEGHPDLLQKTGSNK